jgi:hypothetical protein
VYRNRGKAPAHETDRASKKRKEGPQRRRGSSSSQGGGSYHPQRFVDRERAERFWVIDDWNFIAERRVELRDGECQEFTGMLTLHNWWSIASLLEKFDLEIVKEFYANAFGGKDTKTREKVSVVRSIQVPYDVDWINEKIHGGVISPISTYERSEGVVNDFTRMRNQGDLDLQTT